MSDAAIRVRGLTKSYGDLADDDLAWRQRIGIVLQSSEDFADLTVEETVRHFRHYFPHPRDTDEVIALTGLEQKRRARIRALSGGQRRRLDVALGILGGPELLFLDEPTTGFDPEARRGFWSLISDLAGAGTTILLTTHYLDEAEALADRVGVINAGRIVEVSTPAELGGRGSAEVKVVWSDPVSGPQQRWTRTPTAAVQELAAQFGGEVPGLGILRPTLEDTYLRMIGAAA